MENSENKYSFSPEILSALIENGPDYMTELFRIGMNAAMRLERDSFLNAGPCPTSGIRRGSGTRTASSQRPSPRAAAR